MMQPHTFIEGYGSRWRWCDHPGCGRTQRNFIHQPEEQVMTEHTITVAFTVEERGRYEAMFALAEQLGNARGRITSWWIAEDDRTDNSDTDSAVFVKKGSQHEASVMLEQYGMTPAWNVVPKRTEVPGQLTLPGMEDF